MNRASSLAAAAAVALAATPAAAMPSQATVAPGHSLVSTCAGTTYGSGVSPGEVILGGMTTADQSCSYAVSPLLDGPASTSNSAAGGGAHPFANAASASAAVGALHLSATNTGSNAAYFPGAQALAGWNDQITMNIGPVGSAQVWIVPLHVSGTLTASGAYGAASGFTLTPFLNGIRLSHYDSPTYAAFLAANPTMPFDYENYYQYDQGETWALERIDTDRVVVIDRTVNFAIPIISGTPFTLGIYGEIIAGEDSYGNGTDPNGSTADFAHTITWGGKGYVVAADGSGPHLTNFTVSSLSGFDYSRSAVPEPAVWMSMVLGLGAIGTLARRRRVATVAA